MHGILKISVLIALIAIGVSVAVYFAEQKNALPFSSTEEPVEEVAELQKLAPRIALYTVAFDALWSEDAGHTNIPEGAHFSPFVAWSHKKDFSVFDIDEKATEGIRMMAETGDTQILIKELEQYKQAGEVGEYVIGNLIQSPGAVEKVLQVSQKYKYVTVVSMLAPSPDWFVGIRDLELFEANEWRGEMLNISMVAYDAGTDKGEEFTSEDSSNDPYESISLLADHDVLVEEGGGPIASVSFILRNAGSVDENESASEEDGGDEDESESEEA